jgi:hypothetical protein
MLVNGLEGTWLSPVDMLLAERHHVRAETPVNSNSAKGRGAEQVALDGLRRPNRHV